MFGSFDKAGRRGGGAWRLLAFAVVLVATAAGAFYVGRSQSPASLQERDRESLELYAEALDVVRDDYVDQGALDPEKQTRGAIEGMLDTLGDKGHTRFLTPEERKQNQAGLSGTYVGIGVQLEMRGDDVVISAPIEGSPAEEAGVESGDVVVGVDGEGVRGEEISGIVSKVKGPEGTRVELTVSRDGEERVFDLRREEIDSPVVSWARIQGTDVAHVLLSSFSNDAAEELRDAFGEAKAAGAERFVLDLRDNPGGRLDQAVEVAGFFLEPGSVAYVRKDASDGREEVEVEGEPGLTDAPLVVLVNEGSASSSEIVAGALRDNDRATVVGQTTFGTGTVLSEFELDDGSSILLGVAEWLTPDGDFIRETGIEPDVTVPPEKGDEAVSPSDLRNLSREEAFERDAQLRAAFEQMPDQ
ncbi:PDZ domain-containing protein [Rubrobacter tropicus]|uniref:PDZ domain-containing protein n=1 Tax=Rubrobacter tropicus TaxID=2653851 RepID=A0A6G8Q7C7_9ACTN|nr:S41 family peptidase [Rubrobacter tropicus]QIN82376.1 PDZ domain-containing protein [Rubrobacter tropicus]